MPLATNPNSRFEYVLETDRQLPKDQQPVFVIKYLTLDAWLNVARLSDKVDAFNGDGDVADNCIELALSAIKMGLVDWRNMPDPRDPAGHYLSFDADKITSILTLGETMELMRAVVSQIPGIEDKKKSDSPLQSGTEQPVNPAPALQSVDPNQQN